MGSAYYLPHETFCRSRRGLVSIHGVFTSRDRSVCAIEARTSNPSNRLPLATRVLVGHPDKSLFNVAVGTKVN